MTMSLILGKHGKSIIKPANQCSLFGLSDSLFRSKKSHSKPDLQGVQIKLAFLAFIG